MLENCCTKVKILAQACEFRSVVSIEATWHRMQRGQIPPLQAEPHNEINMI